MSGPLDGVVVADFSQLAQGPFATQIMGDMGAEIIKIEPPKGDWMRYFAYGNLYPGGESMSFLSFNRNKKSISINLKEEKGVLVFKKSIFVTNDIKKGEKFTKKNIRVIRPGQGLNPKFYKEIIGKKAKQDIKTGTALAKSLIKN